MQFTLIAEDGKDADAMSRRLASKDKHLELAKKMKNEGHILFGAAMVGEGGGVIGSVYIYDFASRADVDEFLKTEPYVIGNVWQQIRIQECKVSPLFASAQ